MHYLDFLRSQREHGKGVLACNFYNAETLKGVLAAAASLQSPIILQTSPSTIDYLGLQLCVSMARSAAAAYDVCIYLHLDHCHDLELLAACVDAGYDSVMIDASEANFDENIQKTRATIQIARAKNVAVEAELGYIPKLGQAALETDGLTSAEEAAAFVAATNVDTLAVSIGTAHGFYKQAPLLDIPRLERIRQQVDTPLVLHGGSGVAPEQWQAAIDHGIVKINFATEIKNAFMQTIKQQLADSDNIDLRQSFPVGMYAVQTLVTEKMLVCDNRTADATVA